MLINEYINIKFNRQYSAKLNEEAVKMSMESALAADNGCLIGQCHPDFWNEIVLMDKNGTYEVSENFTRESSINDYYLETHLLPSFNVLDNIKDFDSADENLYVYAANPSDNMFFIGCSLKAYYSKFSKYFSSEALRYYLKEYKFDESDRNTKKYVKKYFQTKGDGIHELYIAVCRINNRKRKGLIITNPIYPFHHMWNGYSPWRLIDEKIITDLDELKMMPMIYKGQFVTASEEERHTVKINIVKGNVVDYDTDAIVNAANEQLVAGGGVCGAIFSAAGYNRLTKACNEIGCCKTGNAVITDGFDLKSNYIIHAVGPIYRDDSSARYLRRTYINTLNLADAYCCKSIAIPSISTGIYGYPKDKAVKIALDVIVNFHGAVLKEVNLVCFDDETYGLYIKELKRQERLNKIKGSLLGGAIGDALGYPVEFNSYSQLQNKYGETGIEEYELTNGKAIISDDTQMTLFTACGLLWWDSRWKTKGVSPSTTECVYWAYLDWLETQSIKTPKHHEVSWIKCKEQLRERRAPGNTCISALMSGEMGTIENRINSSKGCGGVMRVAPFGLLYPNSDPNETSNAGAEAAAITHGHDLGFISAALLVHIIQSIMNTLDRGNVPGGLEEIISHSLRFITIKYHQSKYIDSFNDLILKAIELSHKSNKPIDDIKQLGEGWVAEEAIAIAIYAVLKGWNFEKAIIIAVNHDGDSDSTGSIAGNIAGAWYGYNKIPLKFKDNLELKNTMKEIAEDLCDGCKMNGYDDYHDPKWVKKYIPYY